jgi:hypothetical protein
VQYRLPKSTQNVIGTVAKKSGSTIRFAIAGAQRLIGLRCFGRTKAA